MVCVWKYMIKTKEKNYKCILIGEISWVYTTAVLCTINFEWQITSSAEVDRTSKNQNLVDSPVSLNERIIEELNWIIQYKLQV